MYSAYELNKQGDNIQPWCTPFPILNQSIVPCPVLTVVSWPVYRFLRRQVRWSGILIKNLQQFVVIHILKGFHIVSEEEVVVFLEFPCFFYDPVYVGNLISGSPAFSKSSLCIWKFLVHILLDLIWRILSITMNKAGEGDGIATDLFKILKDDAVKVLHSICQQIWKTQ